jgi:hypothetical protein
MEGRLIYWSNVSIEKKRVGYLAIKFWAIYDNLLKKLHHYALPSISSFHSQFSCF